MDKPSQVPDQLRVQSALHLPAGQEGLFDEGDENQRECHHAQDVGVSDAHVGIASEQRMKLTISMAVCAARTIPLAPTNVFGYRRIASSSPGKRTGWIIGTRVCSSSQAATSRGNGECWLCRLITRHGTSV